ncbi:hypothetical protein [Cupriavidus agavae]|uniref:Uncharacterized protein n=1 Tax=Cupriavidus agavae TaxID=1001822 RepID=A0A4Q7RIW6_9BURK|nr:hypothetical protein [Cupriavidus agavae]RZT32398.1 hypothetical protein EV147_4143 [Cupriavidus agavae]
MATQRPGGIRSTQVPARPAPPADAFPDTAIWHTRGLQASSRLRAPVARRTPSRQLPPSPLPRLMLWAVLIAVALVCFQAVKHMFR